jgi:signal transduction histidine kinase
VVGGLAGVAGTSVFLPQDPPAPRAPDLLGVALAVLAAVPLGWWRRRPVAAAAFSLAATLGSAALGYGTNLGTFCTVATIAAVALAGRRLAALTFAAVCMLGAVGFSLTTYSEDGSPYTVNGFLLAFMVVVAPVAYAVALREGSRRERDAQDRARATLENAARDAREAATRERTRIARDVHDVVGHHLSAIRVQAAAASGRHDIAGLRATLAAIDGLAADALTQTRRALRRTDTDTDTDIGTDTDPPSGGPGAVLGDLAALVGAVRATGTVVELTVRGDGAVSPLVGEVVYRVVQESLTNVMRHTTRRRAHVALLHDSGVLTVTITDEGVGRRPEHARPRTDPADGRGLRGIRQRVAQMGGTVQAGPRGDDVGWRVSARLPVPAATA